MIRFLLAACLFLITVTVNVMATPVTSYTVDTLPKNALVVLTANSGGIDKRHHGYYLIFNKVDNPALVFRRGQQHDAGFINSRQLLKQWHQIFDRKNAGTHAYIKGKDLYGRLHPLVVELLTPTQDKLGNWRFPIKLLPGDYRRLGTYTGIDVIIPH